MRRNGERGGKERNQMASAKDGVGDERAKEANDPHLRKRRRLRTIKCERISCLAHSRFVSSSSVLPLLNQDKCFSGVGRQIAPMIF